MPVSRNRKNRKNPNVKHTHKDVKNINKAYFRKLDEFRELSLEELKELKALGSQKGTYGVALTSAINEKQLPVVISPATGDVAEVQ